MKPASRRWLAALLSLGAPGIGQLYAGRPLRAIAFVMATAVAILLASYSLLLVPAPWGVLLAVALTLGLAIVAAIDGWRLVSRNAMGELRPASSRWYVVLPVFVATAIGTYAEHNIRKDRLVEAVAFPSNSMEPAVLAGEDIVVDKRHSARTPLRGTVIIHQSVDEPQMRLMKRLVALPHDTIAMRAGMFSINGRRVMEPYVAEFVRLHGVDEFQRNAMRTWQLRYLVGSVDSAGYSPDLHDWGPLVVPADSFFALGDNRNLSWDSRYYGFVPIANILGRVRYVYLSRDTSGSIRWRRIGTIVR